MKNSFLRRGIAGIAVAGAVALVIVQTEKSPVRAAMQNAGQNPALNPAALQYKLPDQIKWTEDASGARSAVLAGDPSKPGLYVMMVEWTPHHMSHPHFHPNDRFITVLSGTWWVGTGTKYDPDSTVAMPQGSFVRHVANQVHYDGAKDVPAVLEIVGEGPATATPAEVK